MKTQKLLKILTLAIGFLTAGFSFGLNGDIFEIKPCDENGLPKDYGASITKPLTSGDAIYFNVRLIGRDYHEGTTSFGRWYLEHKGSADEILDSLSAPLMLGIYVSGKVQYAELHKCLEGGVDGTSRFTDLVFKYVTKPGDVALPIVLQTSGGPASDVLFDDASYMIYNTGKWALKNAHGDTCNLWYWEASEAATAEIPEAFWRAIESPDDPSGERTQDSSLAKCNFYVQTVDFDDTWQIAKGEADELWRSVHERSTITADGLTPKLKAIAAPTEKVTLYVWSDNEEAVFVKSSELVDLQNSNVPGDTVKTHIGTVTIAGGQVYADFQIEGADGGQGRTANLILSPWKNYNYSDATGARIIDYVKVPVKCLEPLPPTITVETDRQIAYANGNYMVYGAVLSVYLSEAYTADMVVKITPTLSDGNAAEMGDYLRFSETQTEVTALPDYQIPTVTIPAGSTAKKQLYVFILRGDTRTSGTSRIVFTPSVEDAAAQSFIKNTITAGMQVVAEAPVIIQPAEASKFYAICGEDTPLELEVSDTFADSSDVDTGYQIWVKYRNGDTYKKLDGAYYIGEGGALYLLDENATGVDRKTTIRPVLNYPTSSTDEIPHKSQIKIKSPISGKESVVVNFDAIIKEARKSFVIETNDTYEFREGEQGTFQITLSEPNDTGNTIYAFLKASDNIKAGMLSGTPLFVVCDDTDLTKTRGLAINKNNSETSKSKIKFLDGLGDDAGGLSVQFEVVLCSTSTYDKDKILPGYDSNYLNLTVYNEEPVIKRLEMNGIESEVDGYTYPNKYPKGMMRKFVAVVDDKGAYDKTTTEVGEEFQCKWTIKREGMTYGDPITLKGNPANNPLEFNFPQAGKWTIRLQVKDKDMDDWAETDYEVHVNILDNPFVEITADEAYNENEKSKTIKVGLSYWDDNYFDTLKVKVTVDNWVTGKENYGYFTLDGAFKSTDPADGDNVYYVELRNAAPVDIRITELDGTENSSLYGFKVTAEVVSTTILPTSGQSANTYYLKDEKQVLVNNVAPICEMIPEPSTNRWVVSGGVDKTHPLNWKVRSDVINDFTGLWEGVATNGVKVSIFGPVNAREFYVSEATSDTFYPDFGDMQGDVDVTFLFEDKDGGSVTYVYQYKVRPSKFLITSAHGPGGGLATSPLSRKYALLDTLGEGHTFAKEVTFSSAEDFRLKWNCGNRTYAEVYAFGYKVANPVDDGNLDNKKDTALTPDGSYKSDAVDFYKYPLASLAKYNERVDSFFYCWLIHTMDKDGKVSSSILGDTFSPEGIQPGKVATGRVPLPTEETKDGNYINTEVEAIFAKEYLPEDNLGDINLDGIPDVFAHKEWAAGNMIKLASGGEEVNNNLINLAKFNGDGDSLPKVYVGGNGNLNYAPIGPEFTARLEIRGFHEGLNNLSTSQARFCDMGDDGMPKRNKNKLVNADELLAWRAFKKAQWEAKRDELLAEDPEATVEPFDEAMLPTNATDLAEWSPEPSSKNFPRMDPTVEDTDGDGFPDGWEYYLWYTAHVTARVPNSKVRYERFNYNDILVGTEISPDEVEERFNPCVELSPAVYKEYPDFDNDGLSDLEELVIGTNPCHWDTDGDGMCDGWEVLFGLDPLAASDKSANADGDFMAYIDLAQVPGVDNKDGTYTFYPLLVRGKDYSVATVEDEDGNEKIDPSTFTFLRDIKNTRKLIVKGKVAGKTETGEDIPMYYGREKDGDIWGRKLVESMTLETVDFKMSDKTIEGVKFELDYVLLHDQVRIAVGFDPRTGWYSNAKGFVAARWENSANPEAGRAVNTRKYCAYDEYLLMKYRREIKNAPGFDDENPWGTILRNTTNPSVIKVEVIDTPTDDQSSTTNSTVDVETSTNVTNATGVNVTNATGVVSELLDKAFKESGSNKSTVKGHGADSNGNGVPDGWELYMGRNPGLAINDKNQILKPGEADEDIPDDDGTTFDGDKLPYVLEYAGVDSCNAYRDCPSIYNNHPEISGTGWYNKFFPTNPGGFESAEYGYEAEELRFEGADTDGDGIDDDKEFSKFCIDFYNAGNWYSKLELTFIYGSPVDDGTTCIRGGGLNPCSIDTDLDGIPDGWEMQHAGVPVDASAMKTVAPWHLENPAIERILGVKIAEGTFIADGIYKTPESDTNIVSVVDSDGTNTTSNIVIVTPDNNNGKSGVYIAGGMDPTWAGDAKTDYHNEDKLLGTVRDVDFDHDGLQNYQEYLIQAVRHLRYDDISTPLMGRLLTESPSGNHSQKFHGYVPFDAGSATNFVEIAKFYYGAATVNSRVNYVKDDATSSYTEPWTEDGWRNLGYFASPVRHWDAATLSGNAYMFPLIKKMAIHSSDSYPVAGYASSDPRMADTDGDGMDDYYEMFHGLNPILGNDADRVDDSQWGYFTAKQGDIISLTYQMGGATESEDDSASTISISAYRNEWTNPSFHRSSGGGADIGAVKAFDPVLYPWLQGTAMVDSDGDGMRNEEERILANVADPMPRHTDPTPLWFTERTTPISFVSQYYRISYPVKWRVTAYNDTPGISMSLHRGSEYDEYMFSFEEGEGYDTDGDFKYDGAEIIKAFSNATDPLKFDDPDRRQALWLDGVNSFVMSPFSQYRVLNGQDLLKQFTVECWVRPEMEGKAQTIIDRSFWYYGDHVNSDVSAIRANFRIGLYEDGSVYGMFDNNKALESGAESSKSCQFVKGRKLNTNEWAHVALTFDGDALKLYIDGEMASVAHTDLIPANGVYNIVQDPGNFETFPADTYRAKSGALFIGARPVKAADVAGDAFDIGFSAFRNYREFFGGYVDEVRVWDGARTAEEIKGNYRKRFGFNEATQNRDEVLKSFLKGGSRNNNDGMPNLPTELLFHYNFVTLPGAVNASDVAKTPAGFKSQVVDAAAYNGSYGAKSPFVATDINVGWWADSALKSTVYNDYRVVPWIKNTVEHLTPIDGAALDSFMYTDQFGFGYTHATKHGLPNYTFNNTAQPYSSYYLHYGFHFGAIQAEIIADQYGEGYSWVKDYSRFTVRSLFSGSTDLVPLGGAFAKTCPKMWDGAVADAWELTLADDDADGLADWWEKLHATDIDSLSWDSIVERNGVKMTAGEAYKLDIFAGMQPGAGEIKPEYQATIDSDGDNIPDWWEKFYGISESTDIDDNDGDGLSNWAEYLLSEVFDLGFTFDPTDAKSVNGFDLDYFVKIGELYAGEIFSDHDFIDDRQEDDWGMSYASRYAWDADKDSDEDGWSNFAEARYNDFTKSIIAPYVSHVIGDSEIKDMPIPTLKLTLRYNGKQPLSGNNSNQNGDTQVSGSLAPIVVQTYTDKDLIKPDATFKVQPGAEVANTVYIGAWADKVVSGTLTPGHISATSFKLEFAQIDTDKCCTFLVRDLSKIDPIAAAKWPSNYYTEDYNTYLELLEKFGYGYIVLQSGEFKWSTFAEDRVIILTNEGSLQLVGKTIGKVDLITGDYSIDLGPLQDILTQEAGSDSAPVFNVKQSVLRFNYNAVVPALQANKLELFLGETEEGFVKEGKNTIIAFYDLDGDGKYTPGEPMGTAVGVDVGWRQGKTVIELTDVNPIISRLDLATGISDRSAIYGSDESHDRSNTVGRLMVNDFERVRVVRRYTVIRKQSAEGKITESLAYLPVQKEVLNKILTKTSNGDSEIKNTRSYLMEGDFLVDGELDIDWSALKDEAIDHPNVKDGIYGQLDLTHIVYEIFLGDGLLPEQNQKADNSTADAHSVLLVRRFDSNDMRPTPEAISPGSKDIKVLRPNPIFKWKLPNPAVPNMVHDGYTAFKIEIRKDGTTVWDSGYQRAPARDIDGVYTFEADAYIGDELKNNETYTWRVSMYNAKFKDDKWSSESSFRMTVHEKIEGYADIPVCVKYFGPSKVKDASTFVVEAFKTPDFTGIPAARVVVDDAESVTAVGVSHSTNAVLRGLSTGKYFLRAYADMNAGSAVKRKRDSFESWGYACGRDKTVSRIYSPIEFELTSKNGFEKPIDIYIEDVDTNGNSLPDAWEYVTNGGKLDVGTKNLDGDIEGTFSIASVLSDYLRDKVVSGLPADAFNNYIITSFMSPKMMALALGYNPDTVTVGSNGSIQVESKVESVEIKSVSFDANGNVVVEIDGELNTAEGNTNGLGFITLEGETSKTVTCQVLWKSSLSDTEWTVKAEKKVTVGNGAQTIDISGVGSEASGFFKVVVTE